MGGDGYVRLGVQIEVDIPAEQIAPRQLPRNRDRPLQRPIGGSGPHGGNAQAAYLRLRDRCQHPIRIDRSAPHLFEAIHFVSTIGGFCVHQIIRPRRHSTERVGTGGIAGGRNERFGPLDRHQHPAMILNKITPGIGK